MSRLPLFVLLVLGCSAADEESTAATCPAPGASLGVGEVAGDVQWQDHTGAEVTLRGQCGAGAVVVVETAIWSATDALAAPTLKAWAAAWPNVRVILAVGEDQFSNAAEAHDAKRHKEDQVYPDSVTVVADPLWAGIRGAAGYQGMVGKMATVPWFVVLDSELRVSYVGAGGMAPSYPEVQEQIETLTGIAYQVPTGCQGFCGGQSAAGCFCTAECNVFGDCCDDVCNACGSCQ